MTTDRNRPFREPFLPTDEKEEGKEEEEEGGKKKKSNEKSETSKR